MSGVEPSAMLDFFRTVLASGIGFALAKLFIGWLEARFSKARFLEAERNSDTDRATDLIEKLVEDGCNYWSSDIAAFLPTLAYQIPPTLLEVGGLFESLFEGETESLRRLQICLNKFDTSITGDEFSFGTRPQRLDKITEIRTAAGQLKTELRNERRKLPPKWFG